MNRTTNMGILVFVHNIIKEITKNLEKGQRLICIILATKREKNTTIDQIIFNESIGLVYEWKS